MAGRQDISEARWEQLKPEIIDLYNDQNFTVTDIRKRMIAKYGLDATERQYKSRLHTWGKDKTKKIECWLYNAMNLVMESRDRPCTFIVPMRDGHAMLGKPPQDVRKQWKRCQNSEKWRKYKQEHPDHNSVPGAYEMLSAHDIQIIDLPTTSTSRKSRRYSRSEPSNSESSSGSDMDDVVSELQSSPILAWQASSAVAKTVATTSYFPNQLARFVPGAEKPSPAERARQWDSLPSVRKIMSDTECSALPEKERPTFALDHAGPLHVIEMPSDSYVSSDTAFQQEDDLSETLTSLSLSKSSDTPLFDPFQTFWGISVAHKPPISYSSTKRDAAEWALYYLQQCLAGFDTLDHRDHPDHHQAESTFKRMFKQDNPWILPYVMWLTTVLGSRGKQDQLREFLEDCHRNIPLANASHAWVETYDVSFSYLLATHMKWNEQMTEYGSRLGELLHRLGDARGEKKAHILIMRTQFAHYLLDQGRYTEAKHSLLECLSLSEQVMGHQHLITVNCLVTLSRACALLGQTNEAIENLRYALRRQRRTPKPLEAFYHRLLRRLAKLQLKAGLLDEAEQALLIVLDFRITTFGINNPITWDAIRYLERVYELQGRFNDASNFSKEMRARFDHDQAQHYKNMHGHSPPWNLKDDYDDE